MAFDDVNTRPAIIIWLNGLVSYTIFLIYITIMMVHNLFTYNYHHAPHAYEPVPTNIPPIMVIMGLMPIILGLLGWYLAYRDRCHRARFIAFLIGIGLLIALLVRDLGNQVDMKTYHWTFFSHFVLYVALSQVFYAVFGRSKDCG